MHERTSVAAVASGLKTLPESVRFACHFARIPLGDAGEFLLPVKGGQRERFFAALASRPGNRAEQLLWDLGYPSRRMILE